MSFVNTFELIGDEALASKIIDRSITEIADNVSKEIGKYAFFGCTNLASANFPSAKSAAIGAFYRCSALKTAVFQELTTTADNAFRECTNLEIANLPSLTQLGSNTFRRCSALTTVNIPMAQGIGVYAFEGCGKLAAINFPSATNIANSAFQSCSTLKLVDFPVATNIGSYSFQSCEALTTIILRNTSERAILGDASAFNSTPIASGTGYIYVPRAFLSDDDATKDYRRATNWSNFSAQFRALEDYTVDGTITGELDESKI